MNFALTEVHIKIADCIYHMKIQDALLPHTAQEHILNCEIKKKR